MTAYQASPEVCAAVRRVLEVRYLPAGRRRRLSAPIGAAPAAWSAALKSLWEEIRFALPRDYVLEDDRAGLGILVEFIGFYREIWMGNRSLPRERGIERREIAKWLGDFGVKPKDRLRVLDGKSIVGRKDSSSSPRSGRKK